MIEILIKEARDSNDSNKLNEIPEEFFSLIYNILSEVDNSDINKRLWVAFGQWLGLKPLGVSGKIKRKHVRQHLRLKWSKFCHSLNIQNNKDFQAISNTAVSDKTRKEKVQLVLSSRNNFQSLDELVDIHYISEPECIMNVNGQTLVHLET